MSYSIVDERKRKDPIAARELQKSQSTTSTSTLLEKGNLGSISIQLI